MMVFCFFKKKEEKKNQLTDYYDLFSTYWGLNVTSFKCQWLVYFTLNYHVRETYLSFSGRASKLSILINKIWRVYAICFSWFEIADFLLLRRQVALLWKMDIFFSLSLLRCWTREWDTWTEISALPETFWVALTGLKWHNFAYPKVMSHLRQSLEVFLRQLSGDAGLLAWSQ